VFTEPGLTVFTKIFQSKFLAHIFENICITAFEHKYSGFLVHQVTGKGFTQKILQIFIIFHKSQLNCFSNNSVAQGYSGDTLCIYSFTGIDESKLFSGIHLKSWKYNTISQ